MFLKSIDSNDPRLYSPQCESLKPVATVHKNPWFSVKDRGGYFTVEYNEPQIVILPIVNDDSVIIVRAKRPVIADNTLELPAGAVEKNEFPVKAASRELFEETGVLINDIGRFKPLIPISYSPNRNPLLLHVFQINVTKKEFEERRAHDNEIISVECFKFAEIKKLIASGSIYVSVPVAVIGRYFLQNNLDF
jgi:8-oxo-dGTP pyrophosphatase MutT (NUDIX family)